VRIRIAPSALYAALVVLLSVAPVLADTVGTFADPTADGSTPLFTVGTTTLGGGWSGTGLDLIVPITGQTYQDATFTMTDVAITDSQLGSGTIEFYASAADGGGLLLRIVFDGGVLFAPLGFQASAESGNTVTFSGPVITDTLSETAFAFGFANQISTAAGTTYTGTFISSGTPQTGDGGGDGGAGANGGTGGTTGDTTPTVTPPPGLCGPLPCTTLTMLPLSLLAFGWLKIRGGPRGQSPA